MTGPLVPHPWDGVGEPPAAGYAYDLADTVTEVTRLARLAKQYDAEAEEKEREAHRLEDDATIRRSAAEAARGHARQMIERTVDNDDEDRRAELLNLLDPMAELIP